MKNLLTIGKSLCGLFLSAAIVLPLTWSCKDDSLINEMEELKNKIEQLENEKNQQKDDGNDEELDGIKDQIDLIIDRLLALEEQMNAEIQALKDLLDGKIFVTDVSVDASTGITTVKLSNGSELQLLPEKDLKSFVTYIQLSDGVNYWGYIDADGTKKLFYDENNQPIPVGAGTPEVVVKNGETYLVIGGVEYPLSGNSIFSDYEVIVDELTGEPYAVTFTFGDDMTFTVTVDGACGFHFVKPMGWSTVIIEDYFVANGLTERVQIDARGVVEYVVQAPDGWKVKEYEDIYMGTRYLDITAPSKELVASGAAVSEGYLKVIAVLEGGKSAAAKLNLSTEPFKEVEVSFGEVSLTMFNGLQKFVYGVCLASEYDESSIIQTAGELLYSYDYPAGYAVSDSDIDCLSLIELAGSELVPGESYVFWAVPALYYQTEEDAGYYLNEGTFVSVPFKYSSIEFAVTRETITDAEVKMNLQGVDSYYMELVPKAEFLLEDVLFGLDLGFYEAKTAPMEYEGSVFELVGIEAETATAYVAWLAVAENGKSYTEADVVVCEFSTLSYTSGGTVNVTAGDVKESPLNVNVELTAAGAKSLYYSFLTAANAKKYADDDARANYLFENGKVSETGSAEVRAADFIAKLKPETDVVLFAVAVDQEGRYGQVLVLDAATTVITYNEMSVSLKTVKNDPGNVKVQVSVSGGTPEGYLYWIGKVSDNTWKSTNYLGGSVETAQAYMYINSDNYRFSDVQAKYPVVDGVITMTDLALNESYVMVLMAKDKDGGYSQAGELRFKPYPIALGNIVSSDDARWNAVKPVFSWLPEEFEPTTGMMYAKYAFTYDSPDDMTAYVLCGTESYLDEGGTITDMTIEDKIIKIVQMTDKPADKDILVDEELWESTGSMDAWQWFHYQHGSAIFGNAVIFPGSAADHDGCEACEGYTGDNQIVIYHSAEGPVEFRMPDAVGADDIDKVYVVLVDKDGNFYEPYMVDVPDEYFELAKENM